MAGCGVDDVDHVIPADAAGCCVDDVDNAIPAAAGFAVDDAEHALFVGGEQDCGGSEDCGVDDGPSTN